MRPRPSPSRRRRAGGPGAVLLCTLLAVLAALTACGQKSEAPAAVSDTENPFAAAAQTVVANPLLVARAKQAATDGDAEEAAILQRLAGVPTGIWLTPETYPVDQVGGYVSAIVSTAAGTSVPLFVIYGIPDRDCSGTFSAGGLTDSTYLPWVRAIAAAVGTAGVVVLEPDALADATSCDHRSERISLLSQAVQALHEADVTTYVDAGHSDWISPATMAGLLKSVGVASVRGFSTNVANYQPESAERAYAEQISTRLGGTHYVIDVGRDGDPSGTDQTVSDWCNPPGRALGPNPGFVSDGTPLDALLWIKPPAESDGPCHGGPDAGQLWFERATALARAAGW